MFIWKRTIYVFPHLLKHHFVTFIWQVLIKFPDDGLARFYFDLEAHDLLFKFGYRRHHFFVQVLEIVILGKSLKMLPNSLAILRRKLVRHRLTDIVKLLAQTLQLRIELALLIHDRLDFSLEILVQRIKLLAKDPIDLHQWRLHLFLGRSGIQFLADFFSSGLKPCE